MDRVDDAAGEVETPLLGGNVAAGVVRVGGTVRKPATSATPAVDALLAHLADVGYPGSPRPLGRDGQGRQVLEYIEGPMADTLPPLTPAELGRAGRLIRGLHDATATFVSGARTGTQPWARLHADGHADYWLAAADYIAAHRATWTAALLA